MNISQKSKTLYQNYQLQTGILLRYYYSNKQTLSLHNVHHLSHRPILQFYP
nr:MAG TPA: hypothetical protein [Caudoviricetes sp.]